MLISSWLRTVQTRLRRTRKIVRRQARGPEQRNVERLEDRTLLVAPSLVAVQPNAGTFFDLNSETQLQVAPEQLTLQFNPGQILDAQSALDGGIEILAAGNDGTFADGNEITITPGYIGLGDSAEDLVVRFSQTLHDDEYQITLRGTGTPLTNALGEPLNDGEGDTVVNFSLDLGAKVVAVVPQPVTGNGAAITQALDQIVVYFNNDDLDPASAEDLDFYKLIATNNSVTSADDVEIPPISAVYDSDADTVTLQFPGDIHTLGDGAFRLRIGTDESLPAAPTVTTVATDPGSSFREANTDIGDLSAGGNSTFVFSQNIEPQPYNITFPGANDEPGHREIEPETHLEAGPDATSGSSVIPYNFRLDYGNDPQGNPLTNLITEEQKDRAREIFEYYSTVTGLDFAETENLGLTIVTGDLRALDPAIETGPGGVLGLAGGGMAIMDLAENWNNSPRASGNDGWFETAMHEIGHLLGLGHSYDLPPETILGSTLEAGNGESEFNYPGYHDIVHLQHIFRPDSIDVDLYEFDVTDSGTFTAETIAERDINSSFLDSQLRLYKELPDGQFEVVAQNDDYFSSDSYIALDLEPGKYFIGVSSTGNNDYDPTISNTGFGGTSNGPYQLRLNFRAAANSSIMDVDVDENGDPTPSAFDGDSDGNAGGVFNFWFNAVEPADTIFVDKTATPGLLPQGSQVFNEIDEALAAATYGQIVRIIGNGGTDGDLQTPEDAVSYQIGIDANNATLPDGRDFNVPSGVTVIIDEAAVLKFRRARIGVGSSVATIDRSAASLQVLGTPNNDVYFTSWNNEALGQDTTGSLTFPLSGDWGGIAFQNDVDARSSSFNYQREGVFLNYVNHANITYGGGRVLVDSSLQTVSAIHLTEARPELSWNTITLNADSAISADPDSFEETLFTTPDFQRGSAFTLDYDRVGPNVHDNTLMENSTNGLFVRVLTQAGTERAELTVPGRFDDTDITHVIQETVQISGTPGGGFFATDGPPIDLTFVTNNAAGTLSPTGTYNYRLVFITESGLEGPASDVTNTVTAVNGGLRLNNLPSASGIFTQRRLYRSDATGSGPYTLVAQLDATGPSFVDDGTTLVGTLVPQNEVVLARIDARLAIDPGTVVKFTGAAIEVEDGAQFIAEGGDGQEIIFTSFFDDRYGNSGTFDTNQDAGNTTQAAGDWGGIYASGNTHVSLDHVVIAHGGGAVPVDGGSAAFNSVELHQAASSRITNSLFEANASGLGGVGGTRFGRGVNTDATVFVRNSHVIFVGNTVRDNAAAPLSINVNAMGHEANRDFGRSTGSADVVNQFLDNSGPLIRDNVFGRNGVNGLELRAETLTTEVVLDDADIVHVVRNEIYIPDFHTYGGFRLESSQDQSLVLKFDGDEAGITANGRPLDIIDRIGGMLHVVGQPGSPVVMTSLNDDEYGAGFGLDGLPLNDTNNDGDSDGAPGQWRGILIDEFASDRNVGIIVENETTVQTGLETNNSHVVAETIGLLGDAEKDSDENLRLGFEVHGNIKQPGDVDVYSFEASAGVEVWIDVDNSRHSLDTVIELLDPNGDIVALSNNSIDEQNGTAALQSPGNAVANSLDRSPLISRDLYTTNQRDAGFRVVLPGQAGVAQQYFVRIRSSNIDALDPSANPADLLDESKIGDGLTAGSYQFQIRLRELDEQPGTTIRYGDIRYATNGIEINGQPTHSPLAGEFAETSDVGSAPNSTNLGNLLNSDRAVLALSGTLGGAGVNGGVDNVDLFSFDVQYDALQDEPGEDPLHVPVVIDLDYADGFARANTVLSVFNSAGQLVWMGRDSNVADDRFSPLDELPVSDLSRGSAGALDPYIGPIELPVGTYHLAVSTNDQLPTALDQFFIDGAGDSTVRLEPINSLQRIAEDHFDFINTSSTATAPITTLFDTLGGPNNELDPKHQIPWNLSDQTLYVSTITGTTGNNRAAVQIVNPFTGTNTTRLTGAINQRIGDIAIRPDGELFTYTTGPNAGARNDGNSGNYQNIDVSTGAVSGAGGHGISTLQCDFNTANPPQLVVTTQNSGFDYQAFTFLGTGTNDGLIVGTRNTGPITPTLAGTTNVVYRFDITNGSFVGNGPDRANLDRCNGANTALVEQGTLNVTGQVTGMARLDNGELWAVTDAGLLYQITANATVVSGPFAIPGGAGFAGLTAGSSELENGLYAQTLFGITQGGTLLAFDTTGALQPVFVDGQTSINLGLVGVTGLEFSTLSRNLWNTSTNHGGDIRGNDIDALGHGIYGNSEAGAASFTPGVPDQSRIDEDGGWSLYFGNENDGADAGNRNGLATDVIRDVNFPGGAHGGVISNEFDLSGYDAADKPVLYFNYYLDTENQDFDPLANPVEQMRDSFRVYVGSDTTLSNTTSWSLVATNNNFQDPDRFDEFDFSHDQTLTTFPSAQTFADVQPLFAETGAHTWRQARVDLSKFAGQDNLKLRFEFATAGTTGVGDIDTTGEELRAIPGAELHDGQTFVVDGVTFEFDLGFSLITPSGAAITDQETFDIDGTIFELDTDGAVAAGIAIPITSTMSSAEVAQRVRAVLGANGIPSVIEDNRVNLTTATTLTQTNGTSVTVEGQPGAAGFPVVINANSSREDVAAAMQQALADVFAGGVATAFKTSGDMIRVIGHNVDDPGPLPFTSSLAGDAFGSEYTLVGSQVNNVEGVYVDDIIIGFAERGEMVVNAQADTTFSQNKEIFGGGQDVSLWPTGNDYLDILTGEYDVEIRRATVTGHGESDLAYPHQVLLETADTNDRFVQGVTLTVPPASQIADGDTFTISDGDTLLTFEFEDAQLLNGVGFGNIRVLFDPLAAETGGVGIAPNAAIAQAIRDAINSPSVQGLSSVQATLGDGSYNGALSTSDQVVLFGVAIFDPGTSGITSVTADTFGDGNAFRDQGQIIVESTFVTDSSEWGINVGPGDRTPDQAPLAGNLAHAGPVRNLQNINSRREVPGVILMNNVVATNAIGGIRFAGDDSFNASSAYGRIINNTVVGTGSEFGISIEQLAAPTLMNNIVSSSQLGIRVLAGGTVDQPVPVIIRTAYHNNGSDITTGLGLGSSPLMIDAGDPLFIDPANRNFYPAPGSQVIDSSQDSAEDRPSIGNVKSPLGISPSPINSPDLDIYGQLRADDRETFGNGVGENPFKDRGAIDRVDFEGPRAVLSAPEDEGDEDLYTGFFHIVWRDNPTSLRELAIQLTDSGIGIDHRNIQSSQFELLKNGELQVENVDYIFVFNSATNEVIFRSLTEFDDDARYTIFVDNDSDADDGLIGVRDLAGNFLQANRPDGRTRFDILLTDGVNDPPENLIPIDTDIVPLQVLEDVPLPFVDPITIQVTDPDAFIGDVNLPPDPIGAPQGQLTVTLTVLNGTFTLGDATAVPVVSGDGTALVTMTGNLDELNAALLGASFLSDPDYFGPAEIEIHTDDLGNFSRPPIDPQTDTDTIFIDVLPVNDAPTFNLPTDVRVDEDEGLDEDEGPTANGDAGLITIPAFATNIFAGVNEPDTITTTVTVLATTGTLAFDVLPDIDPVTGDLTFDSSIHTNGSAVIEVFMTDDGVAAPPPNDNESDRQTFTLFVDAVNDRPIFDLPDQATASDEDAGPQVVADFATDIAPGPAEATDEAGQALVFVLDVLSTTSTLQFLSGPAIDAATGDLTYEAVADTAGTAQVSVILMDAGGNVLPDRNVSGSRSFNITVNDINDAPSFDLPADPPTVIEDAGSQSVPGFATNILAGPPSESGQILSFNLIPTATTGTLAFASGPSINSITGELTYTTAPDTNGTATFDVILTDDGSGTSGPDNTSTIATFTLIVTPINDAPTFGLGLSPLEAFEDSGQRLLPGYAIDMTPGPIDEVDEGQTLQFVTTVVNTTGGLVFTIPPTLDPITGDLTFEAATDSTGTATVEVVLVDSGVSAPPPNENTSSVQTFVIQINPAIPATVQGRKFDDLNANGLRDAGEPYLNGWTIELYNDLGFLVTSTVTQDIDLNNDGEIDADTERGHYVFDNVAPISHSVFEVLTGDWLQSLPGTPEVPDGYIVTPVQDEIITGLDFGNFLPATVSGRKFHDINGNAVRDAGEEYLDGWVIDLLDANGDIVLTTTTASIDLNADGSIDPETETGLYEFVDLRPRTYTIREQQQATWGSSLPVSGEYNETLISGQDLFVDFGNYIFASVSGQKFHDHNADGIRDAGDEYLNGWTIELVDANGIVVMSTVTGDLDLNNDGTVESGAYLFENVVPQDYTLREIVSAPWAASTPVDGEIDVAILSDQDYARDFGNFEYATISGRKFLDINGSGGLNSNEEFLNGWTIELVDASGVVVDTKVTQDRDLNSDGSIDPASERGLYEFTNIVPGAYTIREVLAADWVQTTPASGTYDVVFLSGDVVSDRDFGNYAPASVSGRKLHDLNGNSLVDPNEPYLDGWVIELVDITGVVQYSATTTSLDLNADGIIDPATESGWYFIDGVIPGTYTVQEVLQPDWIQSFPGNNVVVSLGNGESVTDVNFANYQNVTIEGQKFHDANGDGVDNDEANLNGFIIELVNRAGNVVRVGTTADSDRNNDGVIDPATERGWYSFDDVFPGDYTVREREVFGYVQSAPASGTYDVSLTSGQSATGLDFGNFQPAFVEGRKFEDLNANGVREIGEPWLNGWTIELVDAATGEVVETRVTRSEDRNRDGVFDGETEVGFYSFDRVVEGTYIVREATPPSGWVPSTSSFTLDLQPLEVARDIDFGNYREVALRGRKWEDLNANGIRETNEPFLANWTIELTLPDDTTASTVTDQDGWYQFSNLRPGDYSVREILQDGWSGVVPNGGPLADEALALDGIYEFYSDGTLPLASQVERRAWFRSAASNDEWFFITQGGQLFKWDGGQIDVGGELIADLNPRYFENPELLYSATPSGVQTISLTSGINLSDVDFANYRDAEISGRKYEDVNENGTRDANEPYLDGWEVQLVTVTGVLVASTTTASVDLNDDGTIDPETETGLYSFTGLLPGNYGLQEISQAGWTQSEPAIAPLASEAFRLGGEFNFYTNGDFFEDQGGQGEKWFRSAEERTSWFYITPEGDIFRWSGETDENGQVVATGSLVGSLTPEYHADPFLLINVGDPTVVDISVISNQSLVDQNFGNHQLNGRISGRKFHDINGNGLQDGNEPALNGWSISITNSANITTTVLTSDIDLNGDGQIDPQTESGWYSFTGLEQDEYELTEEQRAEWSQVAPRTIAIGAGSNARVNFGNWIPGTITGSLFHDLDANGSNNEQVDDGSQTGWTVNLVDLAGNVVATTETDPTGNYEFTNVDPGTYQVNEVLPAGWLQSSPGDDGFAAVAQNLDATYGLSLTGNLYENWGGLGERWVFGEGGNWFFILPDGRFFRWDGVSGQGNTALSGTELTEFPTTYFDNPGLITDPVDTRVNVLSDQFVSGIDFGNYQLATISGRKWLDTDGDGERATDGTEPYANGWTIHLLDSNGEILQTVITQTIDGQVGTYSFTDVRPGDYLVEEEFVPGFIQTATNDVLETTPDPGEVFGPNASEAFALDSQFEFDATASNFLDWGGRGEKWFVSDSENAWFYILPNGELYRWDGVSGRTSELNGSLITQLDPAYHANTSLLHDAREPGVAVSSGQNIDGFAFGNHEVDDAFAGLGGLLD